MVVTLKRTMAGFIAVVLTLALLAVFSGRTVKAAGFTTLVSDNAGYVGACKRLIDTGGFGWVWAVDTIVTTYAGGSASGFIMTQNSGGTTIRTNRYNASNGSWNGGTDYASNSLGETISIQGTTSLNPGGSWVSLTYMSWC